ncbi:30S ribosomal protein S12 methylthiotransferase RimO [Acidobacteriota bacterium]
MKTLVTPKKQARTGQGPKVALISLGCPKNTVDSEAMLGLLSRAGFRVGSQPDKAEIIIVNTCGFIGPAKEESIDAILEAGRLRTDGPCRKLIVAGCLAERYREELKKELIEVDDFLGIHELTKIVQLAGGRTTGIPTLTRNGVLPRTLSTPPAMAYLKISEGCDNRCGYCAIPMIRGSLRSRPPAAIIKEAKKLAGDGVIELTLVAQDSTSYGLDLDPQVRLGDLLSEINRIRRLRWIRLLYLHPARVNRKLLDRLQTQPKVCAYFDIPFQHVSGAILRKMGRPGSGELYLKKIEMVRETFPRSVIRSSFIIGFPGEDRSVFSELLAFLKAAKLDYAGAFLYSPEEGTKTYALGDPVSKRTKERRWHRFMQLQAEITAERNEARVGTIEDVLVEHRVKEKPGWLAGRTRGQAPEIDGVTYFQGPARPGTLVRTKIIGADVYDLIGRVL